MPVLRGITWDHRRAIDPLTATLPGFRRNHPDVEITWQSRSLHGFEFAPVFELARDFDLIILDHPFCGAIAQSKCLLALDGLLDGLDAAFVGPTLASYRYDGHVWALPVDAACQVAVSRPDLMAELGQPVPRTWEEMFALARVSSRRGMKLAVAFKGVHSLMTFFTLCANLGAPCATETTEPFVDRETAREALGTMRQLIALCPAEALDWNSIALHDAMVARNDLVYCPAVYCYATYAEAGVRRPLRFHDLPGLGSADPRGSTIGGTALGVSALCPEPEAALSYARFMLQPVTQAGFALYHGQPARTEAWDSPEIDLRFGRCFSATRKTMEACWIRPRYDGYLGFQARGGALVESHLRGDLDESALLAALAELHRSGGALGTDSKPGANELRWGRA
jgi:multiple sugar transport system substrate-binding protein